MRTMKNKHKIDWRVKRVIGISRAILKSQETGDLEFLKKYLLAKEKEHKERYTDYMSKKCSAELNIKFAETGIANSNKSNRTPEEKEKEINENLKDIERHQREIQTYRRLAKTYLDLWRDVKAQILILDEVIENEVKNIYTKYEQT